MTDLAKQVTMIAEKFTAPMLAEITKQLQGAGAELAIKDAVVENLNKKIGRLEAYIVEDLRKNCNDEVSFHCRYNSLKQQLKAFLDEKERTKLLAQSREGATKLLVPFMKDQEAKYGAFDDKEKAIDEEDQQKLAGGSKGTKSPIAKKGSKGGKATAGDKSKPKPKPKKPKRKAVPNARARFMSDIAPEWREKQAKAKAEGKEFPPLFVYVTDPWNNLDLVEKKRKYIAPYEADKKKRAEEEAAQAAQPPIKQGGAKQKAIHDDDDDDDDDDEANELWKALDPNLPEKSSAVKVVVQARCVALLEHPALREWKRLARVAARGAHALFLTATDSWDTKEAYEPFALVGKRSEVVVTEGAREEWEAGLAAHKELLALEDFGALTPEQVGGLFLLTHTPDNWVKAVSSFGFDYWWLRILHLSVERNADLRIGDFALVSPNASDPSDAAMEMAQKQIATIVALKVAIFYKLRRPGAPGPRVTRHDLEQAKRKWLNRPQARKRRRCEGVADVVSAAMNASGLKALRPTHEVLAEATAQRGVLSQRIERLDQLVRTSRAWQRAVEEQHARVQVGLMARIHAIRSAGMDATEVEKACTAEVLQKKAIAAAKASLTATGLALAPEDSVWHSERESVRKLVAVGAGIAAGRPATCYVRSPEEFKRLFGNGSSGECGQRSTARAAVVELEVLTERLLALIALDFRLRSSRAAACPLPLELQPDLAVGDDAPRSKPPAHIELYHRAVKQQLVALRHVGVFEEAISRAVCHAVRSAFYGCLQLLSEDGLATVSKGCELTPRTPPRLRAAHNVVNCMLTIAACFDGVVSSDAPEEEESAIVVYNPATHALGMPCLESAVARVWPAVRLLADVAAECEGWVRNPRKRVASFDNPDADIAWWVSCAPTGLAVAPERKPFALLAVQAMRTDWWEAWPPSREQVATPKTTATAIKWGGRATAAFLGIAKPSQFMGTPPFYGHCA